MSFQKDHVILVNERDEWIGTMEKMAAHEAGALHRAFSIFVLNDKHEMLIQQRADGKYHSAGLWSNTCCSHPFPGESTIDGAHRRLKEEMGFDCRLRPLFQLRYRSEVGNGLVENEFDHIYIGNYNGPVTISPEEVRDYRFLPLGALNEWIRTEPTLFTQWFLIAMPQFLKNLKEAGQAV